MPFAPYDAASASIAIAPVSLLTQLLLPSGSRHHARIRVRGPEATLEDLGSQHGSWHRTTRVKDTIVLAHGDEIRMGTAMPPLGAYRGKILSKLPPRIAARVAASAPMSSSASSCRSKTSLFQPLGKNDESDPNSSR
jgi:pSer/pThr/pTyr-binding forkhead associated (FHA) protein